MSRTPTAPRAGPFWWIASAVVVLAGAMGVQAVTTPSDLTLWKWFAAVMTLTAALSLIACARFRAVALARHEAVTAAHLRAKAMAFETAHLVHVRVPALVQAVAAGDGRVTVPGPAQPHAAQPVIEHHQELLDLVAERLTDEAQLGEYSRNTVVALARRIQVMTRQLTAVLSRMEHEHDDAEVLAGLFEADHAAAQMDRQAQTLALLWGEQPGRSWPKPVTVVDVVRAASSRVLRFQRIEVRGAVDAAVDRPYVEPLIHASAELLDNATRYSPPTAPVVATIRPVYQGVVVEIEDGGGGLTDEALRAAAAVLSGRAGRDVRRLGEHPKLGLPAVGMLAAAYGFTVTVASPSSYGGAKAVILIPDALLTAPPAVGSPPTEFAAALATAPVAPPPPSAPSGLPRRKSRRRSNRHRRDDAPPDQPPTRSPQEAAHVLGALQHGSATGRAATARPHDPTDPEGAA